MYRNAKPCGGALLVRDDGALLLVRRTIDPWRGRWDIPGGFCEEREHPMAAAERELEEETGISGRAVRFLGMWIDDYKDGEVTLNAYYVCEPAGQLEATTDSDEVSDVRWFAPDELPPEDEMSFPDHQPRVLQAWLATRGDPAQRLVDRPD